MENLNREVIKTLSNASTTATSAMLLLALRERNKPYTPLAVMKDQLIKMGEKVVDADYKQFWKDLEAAGVGSLILGRKGNPDRFQWNYSLKDVARSVVDDKGEAIKAFASKKPAKRVRLASKASRPARKAPTPKPVLPPTPKATASVVYLIPVRKDVTLKVALPSDLTPSELAGICSAFKAI